MIKNNSLVNSGSFLIFKKNILPFLRPAANSVYNCHNPKGIKLITGLRLGLSHLKEHKFKCNFQESLKLVSAIFYQIFIFLQMIAPQKL